MIKNQKVNQTQGNINYLVIEYLKSLPFNNQDQKDQIIKKLEENLSFGNIYDINLISHDSDYDMRGEILRHLNTSNLNTIVNEFFCTKPIESKNFYISEKTNTQKLNIISKNSQNIPKISNFLNFHQNLNFEISKSEKQNLEYRTIYNYNHMKTILGHVTLDENLSITPARIFCLCFSENDEFIFTGDDAGRIKIWSTSTGAIVDTFRLYSPNEESCAINDIISFNNCLIACSEENNLVIWNQKTFQIFGTISFDEPIQYINGYKYEYENIIRNLILVGSESGKMYFIDMDTNEKTNEEYLNIFPIKFHIDKSIQEKWDLGKNKSNNLTGMASENYNGLLVTGYNDGLVCIWDTKRILQNAIQKREFLHNFVQYTFYAELCHRTTVHLVEFSNDKLHFITGSLDGTVLVWKIFPDIIKNIRKLYYNCNKVINNIEIDKSIPVTNIAIINESEDRIKCSVNAANWTKNGNYVIAMICSKPRKKNKLEECNQINFHEEENNKKRSSSLIVYNLKLNKIINKFNKNHGPKGLNFVDENFIFGCHPLHEEIIFTLNGTRHIILFNIKTGEIIKKFRQNDLFFTYDKKQPLVCEGTFSKKGDYFAVSTYSGCLSIFSIYSKNSYSATYMNQFYSNEFEPANFQDVNLLKKDIPPLWWILPHPVNMYNLPYIIEQPYSCFKLSNILSFDKIIKKNYCISEKELKNRFLANNLVYYEKNFEERVRDCKKEEEAYYHAEKDNMNYRINNRNNSDGEEDNENNDIQQNESSEENESLTNNNNENNNINNNVNNINNNITNNNNNINNSRRENYYNYYLNDYQLDEDIELNSHQNNNIINNNNSWNQRLRHPINTRTRRNHINSNNNNSNIQTRYNLRGNSVNNSIFNNNSIDNLNSTANTHYSLRNRGINNNNENNENETEDISGRKKKKIITDEEDKKEEYEYEEEDDIIIINKQNKHEHDNNNNSSEEEKNSENKKKKNKKIINDDEEEYEESKMDESLDDREYAAAVEKGKEKIEFDEYSNYSDNEIEEEEDDDYSDEDYDSGHHHNYKKNKKYRKESSESEEIIEDVKYKKDPDFLKKKNHKFLMEKLTDDKKIHTCFFCHENFLADTKKSSPDPKIFGPFYLNENSNKILASQPVGTHLELKEIYIDLRCLAENNDFAQASKRDFVFNPTTTIEEVIKQNKTCFRCGNSFATKKCNECQKYFHGNLCLNQFTEKYKSNYYCFECYKNKQLKNYDNKIKLSKKLKYNLYSKNYFIQNKIYNSQYFPQLNEEVYFILHAYLNFLKSKYEYILCEFDNKQRLFFWQDIKYINKNPNFNFYEPFLCKIKNIEYQFPNEQTLFLLKNKYGNNLQEHILILIKLTLEILDLDKSELTIFLFENDEPDFIVRKEIYEETLKYYQENILTKKTTDLKLNLSEDTINVILIDNKPEENNAHFALSKYNAMKVVSDNIEQKFSFWDIAININFKNEKLKYIMENLLETVNSLIEKNQQLNVFLEMVNEDFADGYYEEIAVPMYLNLIKERLENKYYLTEDSIKFDIKLLSENANKYNGNDSKIGKEAEILMDRLFNEINNLNNKFENKKNSISNNNIKEEDKKTLNKKRKRMFTNLGLDEGLFKGEDEKSEDYLYGNQKKRELRSRDQGININISIDSERNSSKKKNGKKGKRK